MIGYTISSLNSNQSILEKLVKLEKYLRDHPFLNLLITTTTISSNIVARAVIINASNITISIDDLILDASGKLYAVTSADETNAYVDYANPVSLPAGPQGPQGPAGQDGQDGQDGTNGTNGVDGKYIVSAVVNNVSDTTATITFTFSDSTTYTTPTFNIVTQDYIDTILGDINTILDNINGEVI